MMQNILPTFVLCIFCIQSFSQVTDIDGNTYPTVVLGNQEWMTENLRTSRLNDGTSLLLETNNAAWSTLNVAAMCWYNNDSAQHNVPYGRMYNGHAALEENICPIGWSVPTTQEWDQMIVFLGGSMTAGGKLKHEGTTYWDEPNTGATNSSGFTAMPSGFRSNMDGSFLYKGQRAGWYVTANRDVAFRWVSWSTEASGTGAIAPESGLAIRCFRPVNISVTENELIASIRAYPNPTQRLLQIELPPQNVAKTYELHILDLTGRTVWQKNYHEGSHTIDLSHLANGSYVLRVAVEGHSHFTKKIILSK